MKFVVERIPVASSSSPKFSTNWRTAAPPPLTSTWKYARQEPSVKSSLLGQ
ncbi:MAG: hypothetical protein IJS63_00475 [Bacteroidaceae bacterium]|nr:hypothetical protein [Bacteroidaceae bacterium]